MHPRLHLDIGWADLLSVLVPLGRTRAQLQASVRGAWPPHALTALSVRTAFDAVLGALKLPHGAKVAMSAVNIENMIDIVRAHGLHPEPVDIDLRRLSPAAADLERVFADRRVRAYVHAHLFGSRNDLSAVSAMCRARNITLIEDCAQGYGGTPHIGTPVADVSLYSFGPIKARTCLAGAVAVCREAELASAVNSRLAVHEPMPEHWLRLRAFKFSALKLLSIPSVYRLLMYALRVLRLDPESVVGGVARGFRGRDLLAALRRAPPRTLLRLMERRVVRAEQRRWRIDAGAILDQELGSMFQRPGAEASKQEFWLYPILVENPDGAATKLRAEGFDATRGATSLRAVKAQSCDPPTNASLLLRHVLYLPIGPRMDGRDLKRMAKVVRDEMRPLSLGEKCAA